MSSQDLTSIVPSSPADRKKIRDAIMEIHDSMTRVEGERSLISETYKAIAEEYKIPAKFLRKVVSIYYKQNKTAVDDEAEFIDVLYTKLFDKNATSEE